MLHQFQMSVFLFFFFFLSLMCLSQNLNEILTWHFVNESLKYCLASLSNLVIQ